MMGSSCKDSSSDSSAESSDLSETDATDLGLKTGGPWFDGVLMSGIVMELSVLPMCDRVMETSSNGGGEVAETTTDLSSSKEGGGVKTDGTTPWGGALRDSSIVVATLMFIGVARLTVARQNGLLSMKDLTDLVMEFIF